MQVAELTLEAALRDATSERVEARHKAIRNLAPALLERLGKEGPRWRASTEHALGPDVRKTLSLALADEDPALRGLAAVGLGTLGDPELLPRIQTWIEAPGDDEGSAFVRQCAVIAVSLVGAAAPADGDDADATRAREDATVRLRAALRSERPDVRFQAAIGLVEVADVQAERDLLDALAREDESDDVRENIVAALSRIDPPREATCATMRELLEREPGGAIAFEAAMILASARQTDARPALLDQLGHPLRRDRALEAIAVLGPADVDARGRVHGLATALLTPGVTRVRAAYALSRMTPAGEGGRDPGRALLGKLRYHPRAAVRDAVRDALRLLEPG